MEQGRALAHLDEGELECEKTRRIAELKATGLSPRIDILAHGMEDEETALRVEAAAIDMLRPGQRLTNRVRGQPPSPQSLQKCETTPFQF